MPKIVDRIGAKGGAVIGLGRLLRLAVAVAALGLALARHLQGGLGVLALAWAVQADASYAAALWVRTVTNFAMLLPLSIAGLGIREASFVALLTPLGVAPAAALAMALIVLGYQLLLALLGALLELGSGMAGLRRPVRPADRARAGR